MEVAISKSNILNRMSENIKSIFTKDTLIPVSFMLAMVAPIMYVTHLSAKVNQLEIELKTLKVDSISREVFQLKMENVESKLDQVLKLVELNQKKK